MALKLINVVKTSLLSHKNVAIEYLKLIGSGKYKEGLRFFTTDCKTHNPYVSGSMESLTDAMIAASKNIGKQNTEPAFTVRRVLEDGDFVAVHTELLTNKYNLGDGGLTQVHLFHFKGVKIVEYWDITQQIHMDMPNASGAF
jgi:predicted SnoaL-like aldol condensation-catalyzing enzyme